MSGTASAGREGKEGREERTGNERNGMEKKEACSDASGGRQVLVRAGQGREK